MSRLTTTTARAHAAYLRRAIAAGRYLDEAHRRRLEEMLEHREGFLIRHRACFDCGREIRDPESVKAWETNGHKGPECVKKSVTA